MDNYDTYIHGRIDPGVNENINLLEPVDLKASDAESSKNASSFFSDENGVPSSDFVVQSCPLTGMPLSF